MRAGLLALAILGCVAVGCSKPADDVPAAVKNEAPLPSSDQQQAEAAARARAYGESMQQSRRPG